MQDLERVHKGAEFHRTQEMVGAGGTPIQGPLRFEEGLHEEQATGGYALQDPGHAGTIKIIEEQDRIKAPEFGPRLLEVELQPGDPRSLPLGLAAGLRQPGGVLVHGQHRGPERRGGEAVTPGAAGQVEHPAPRRNPAGVPGEPVTRTGTVQPRRRGSFFLHHGTQSPRRVPVSALADREWDLLVIGGGITGAGIARDATLRGLSVALVDRHDLGWGTSSRSSRLIHGGLRYLEQGRLGLVFESLRERRRLLRLAPHLVRPQAFVLPVHRGDRVPRWKLTIGMLLYDLLAWRGNLPRHRPLGKRAVLALEPLVRERGLTGGALYYDAQCDDARLVIGAARAAAREGAAVASWTTVTQLHQVGGRITEADVEDALEGTTARIRFQTVVNATGPWTDTVRRLEDPAAAPILRPTKGIHIVFPRDRLGHRHAITFSSALDGRTMFVLPWGEYSYVGTTDTDTNDSPDQVTTTREDVHYLLRSVNALFPNAHLAEEDVVATWAALRPLVAAEGATGPSQVSREHRLLEGPGGMLTIAGGKLTTWRSMAAEVVDRVERVLEQRTGRKPIGDHRSRVEPLPGGESAAVTEFARRATESGLTATTGQHLARQYGAETAAILNLVRERPTLATLLHEHHPAIEAEVIHAARREFAVRVEDVLARRIHLAWETADRGIGAAPRVAELLAQELDWPEERMALEVAAYREVVATEFGWKEA